MEGNNKIRDLGYYPKENIIVGYKLEIPAMKWITNWMKARENMPNVLNSLRFGQHHPNLTNAELNHMAMAGVKPFNKDGIDHKVIAYAFIDDDPRQRYTTYQNNPSLSTRIHERTHLLSAKGPLLDYIQKLKDSSDYLDRNLTSWINDKVLSMKGYKSYLDYKDDPTEIYSRLMELRYNNNIDPKKIWTLLDIQLLRKKVRDSEIFSRYSDEFILKLFNEVAQNNNKQDDTVLYAKQGIKLKRRPFSGK